MQPQEEKNEEHSSRRKTIVGFHQRHYIYDPVFMTCDQAGAQLLSETHFICFSKTKKPQKSSQLKRLVAECSAGEPRRRCGSVSRSASLFERSSPFLMRRALVAAVALRPNDRR